MTLTQQTLAERLKKAREFAGLTQEEAAEKAGMTRVALNQVEQAKRKLDTLEMSALARTYRLPLSDLFGENDVLDPLQVLFRASEGVLEGKELKERVSTAFGYFREIALLQNKVMAEAVSFPPLFSYDLAAPAGMGQAIQQGEWVARQERARLGLGEGPLVNLPGLIQDQGIRVAMLRMPVAVSGFTVFSDHDVLMVANSAHAPVRRTFSFAHEYGHARMDKAQTALVSMGDEKALQEARANAFAAAFLLPAQGVKDFLDRQVPKRLDWQSAAALGLAFETSYSAAVFRLINLGHVGKDKGEAWNKEVERAKEWARHQKSAPEPIVEVQGLGEQLVDWALKAFLAGKISRRKGIELAAKSGMSGHAFERKAMDLGWDGVRYVGTLPA